MSKLSDTNLIAKALKNITTRLSRGGKDSPVYAVNKQAPDKTGNVDLSYMARQDKLNNFAVTPTVNGSPVLTAESLQIGDRNLVQGSSDQWTKLNTTWTGKPNYCPSINSIKVAGLEAGDTLTARIVVKWEGITGDGATLIPQTNGDAVNYGASGSMGGFGGQYKFAGDGQHTFISKTTITAAHLTNSKYYSQIRFDNVTGGTVWYKEYTAKKGIQIPDWTPAPEDIQSQIDAINVKLDALA